jgi:hypothetical protein
MMLRLLSAIFIQTLIKTRILVMYNVKLSILVLGIMLVMDFTAIDASLEGACRLLQLSNKMYIAYT